MSLAFTSSVRADEFSNNRARISDLRSIQRQMRAADDRFGQLMEMIGRHNNVSERFWNSKAEEQRLADWQTELAAIARARPALMDRRREAARKITVGLVTRLDDNRLDMSGARLEDLTAGAELAGLDADSTMPATAFATPAAADLWFDVSARATDHEDGVRLRARRNPDLRSCVKALTIRDGTQVQVIRDPRELCIDNKDDALDSVVGQHVAYKLKKERGRILIKLDVDFAYQGAEKNREASLKALATTQACVRRYYARHGLDLLVRPRFVDQLPAPTLYRVGMAVYDDYPRAHSNRVPMLFENGKALSAGYACTMLAHEYGHLLGLVDTYPDAECPLRKTVREKEDLMYWGGNGNPDEMHFMPEDIREIVAPLCDGRAAADAR